MAFVIASASRGAVWRSAVPPRGRSATIYRRLVAFDRFDAEVRRVRIAHGSVSRIAADRIYPKTAVAKPTASLAIRRAPCSVKKAVGPAPRTVRELGVNGTLPNAGRRVGQVVDVVVQALRTSIPRTSSRASTQTAPTVPSRRSSVRTEVPEQLPGDVVRQPRPPTAGQARPSSSLSGPSCPCPWPPRRADPSSGRAVPSGASGSPPRLPEEMSSREEPRRLLRFTVAAPVPC